MLHLLTCLSLASVTFASPCVDPTWTREQVIVQKDIPYGAAVDAAIGLNLTLFLDAYFPPASDKHTLRPGAVLVHGGSFQSGSKSSDDIPELAYNLAMRGFVAVSIDYRLDGNYYSLNTDKPVMSAQEDARAAVRYMRKMTKEWNIDSDRILMAGDSAGAITSLYVGYVKKAQYEGNSGNPGYSSAVALSISVSGELKDEAFCASVYPKPSGCAVEGGNKYDKTADVDGSEFQPPLLMVHGTADDIVPYIDGKAVFHRAQAAGIKSKLITIADAGHVPFYQLFHTGSYLKEFMTFIADALKLGANECPPAGIVV